MIKAEIFNSDVLHLKATEIQLMNLTIYNGKGAI